ncbi:inner membrane protein [Escherichia coli]|uniref:Inner membrane protein n=1 Tax=Escherichia coli TaxID=562 RepID=A0A376Y2J0_ECOLX|nr:inner membrane protein [Escherichia coli]
MLEDQNLISAHGKTSSFTALVNPVGVARYLVARHFVSPMWRRLIYHPDINYALRQTLVLCLPVAVGLMLGELRFGLLSPSFLPVAILRALIRLINVFQTLNHWCVAVCHCSLLTQLLLAKDVPLPFLLTGLTLVLGVTAELGPLHANCFLHRCSPPFLPSVWRDTCRSGNRCSSMRWALSGTDCLTGFGSGSGANNRCASH